jgi:hypothetical protein
MRTQCTQLRSLPQYRLLEPRPTCERERLRASTQEKGVLVPLRAGETLAIPKGRQRYDLCLELGIDEIPV